MELKDNKKQLNNITRLLEIRLGVKSIVMARTSRKGFNPESILEMTAIVKQIDAE